PLLPRKENARARKVPARQRNGYRQEHHRRKRRGDGHQVPRQGQAAVSRDHRKVRIARLLQTCLISAPTRSGRFRFSMLVELWGKMARTINGEKSHESSIS